MCVLPLTAELKCSTQSYDSLINTYSLLDKRKGAANQRVCDPYEHDAVQRRLHSKHPGSFNNLPVGSVLFLLLYDLRIAALYIAH